MASADGELAGWRAAWLRSHLAGCPTCAKDIAELRRLHELVGSRKADYASKQDVQMFWQRLRANLQARSELDTAAGLVMAYSHKTQVREQAPGVSSKPAGIAIFGTLTIRRLAVVGIGMVVVGAVLVSVLLPKGARDKVAELPALAPAGAASVSFSETKSTPDMSANPVKFDKPDVDIHVMWVSGLPYLEKEKANGGAGT